MQRLIRKDRSCRKAFLAYFEEAQKHWGHTGPTWEGWFANGFDAGVAWERERSKQRRRPGVAEGEAMNSKTFRKRNLNRHTEHRDEYFQTVEERDARVKELEAEGYSVKLRNYKWLGSVENLWRLIATRELG